MKIKQCVKSIEKHNIDRKDKATDEVINEVVILLNKQFTLLSVLINSKSFARSHGSAYRRKSNAKEKWHHFPQFLIVKHADISYKTATYFQHDFSKLSVAFANNLQHLF